MLDFTDCVKATMVFVTDVPEQIGDETHRTSVRWADTYRYLLLNFRKSKFDTEGKDTYP